MKINQIGLSRLAAEKIQQTEVLMKTRSFLLAVGVLLAMAFTFSCDSGGGGGDGTVGGNNNCGTDVVPSDLQGLWTMTASIYGATLSGTYTFTANSLVATSEVIAPGQTVSGRATYTATACSPVTNNDNETKTEFPSGYTLTLLVTALEGVLNSDSDLKVGDTYSPALYLNTAKNKMNYVGNVGNAYTKQVGGGGSSSSGGGSSSSNGGQGGGGYTGPYGSIEYGGQTYKTVRIGTQTWMAENLDYDPGTGNSACYDNQASNCATYGRLYDWATAMGFESSCNSNYCKELIQPKHQGICPSGWHIPSNDDWDKLFRYADGTSGTSSPYDSETAGRYLKATSGWNSNGNGTDQYGFSALPGGYGHSDGSFEGIGGGGYWWSSSENGSYYAYFWYMYYYYDGARWGYDNKEYSLSSVRCVQD